MISYSSLKIFKTKYIHTFDFLSTTTLLLILLLQKKKPDTVNYYIHHGDGDD